MPFLLIPLGLMMMVTGIRDTHVQFGNQLRTDLTGDKNFIQYALAIGFVGALGYINDLRTASNTFLALIVISMILSNRGFFQRFSDAMKQGPAPVAPTPGGTDAGGTLANIAKNGITAAGSSIVAPLDPNAANSMLNLGPLGSINWPSQWLGGTK